MVSIASRCPMAMYGHVCVEGKNPGYSYLFTLWKFT